MVLRRGQWGGRELCRQGRCRGSQVEMAAGGSMAMLVPAEMCSCTQRPITGDRESQSSQSQVTERKNSQSQLRERKTTKRKSSALGLNVLNLKVPKPV